MDYPSQEHYISLEKAIQGHADMYIMTGWDGACEEALFPRVPSTVCRAMQMAA
jgi:hypothetical protein